jgi:hypothetical protein
MHIVYKPNLSEMNDKNKEYYRINAKMPLVGPLAI